MKVSVPIVGYYIVVAVAPSWLLQLWPLRGAKGVMHIGRLDKKVRI